MKRPSGNVVACVLGAFIAFVILCSTLAAPGLAIASVSGCSNTPSAMTMPGCERPSYLCGFDYASNLFSSGALGSAQSNGSLKDALGLAIGTSFLDISANHAPPGAREWKNVSFVDPDKVSIRLLNSVQNL